MRDEIFKLFIGELGEANQRVNVPVEIIEKWRGKLPDQLMIYWQDEGWCSYANGLLWIVDPDEYEDLVDEWLEESALAKIDLFHVVARTAFGKLYLCGEKTGRSVSIDCCVHCITALKNSLKPKTNKADLDRSIQSFFAMAGRDRYDMKDESGKPLFARAFKKLGPLAADEMYGFEPAIIAGGRMLLSNLRKVKLDQHLTILRQLAAPRMPYGDLDIDKLIGK